MKIRRISVSLSKTIQAARFEPVEVGFSVDADLEDDDDIAEARAELYKEASKSVRLMMKRDLKTWRAEHDQWHEENS
ncbi:hypothetical protein BcepSauron_293 [Burkholderia phage BcepSauron]|uniref:Uncharacterized protein n=1 Tax=Burkholderia phage BcepSauron TaxID=2530033 RepID=A0A482MNB5_9CAUD|nr:hypothetical protein H1O17_gp293 [Burkholderia phage BcepSauron]QBQ74673.1 hypothetical protein BcepSauron_293 [Burkholderia phage BcepSauron]